jgi:hypothetical protein
MTRDAHCSEETQFVEILTAKTNSLIRQVHVGDADLDPEFAGSSQS